MLENVIVVVHLLVALGVVGLVLVQQGKGADAGASFGSGASATVFWQPGFGDLPESPNCSTGNDFFRYELGFGVLRQAKSGYDRRRWIA